MNLSENFTLEEFCHSDTAVRKKIDNHLPDHLLETARNTTLRLSQPIRDHFGIPYRHTSAYRGVKLNAFIGGSSRSQHCKAEAVDTKIASVPTALLFEFIRDNMNYDQLILEYYDPDEAFSGWVHSSIKMVLSDNRREQFWIDTSGKIRNTDEVIR